MGILSIQSHVSYGHVGNSAAVFPLQRLGHEVWPVHTVIFSNHAGYETVQGPVLPPEEVRAVLSGMRDRGCFEDCEAVLSGYLGSARLGEVVLEAVEAVKRENPDALYCCDPVIGDMDRDIYVRESIPGFIRDKLLPAADILTPNLFELELLSGCKVKDLATAMSAAQILIDMGNSLVLITSFDREDLPAGEIEMLAVSDGQAWLINTPKLEFPVTPNGAGDMCAALFTGHFLRARDLKTALEKTTASVFGMFETTRKLGRRELCVVQGQEELVNPGRQFNARAV